MYDIHTPNSENSSGLHGVTTETNLSSGLMFARDWSNAQKNKQVRQGAAFLSSSASRKQALDRNSQQLQQLLLLCLVPKQVFGFGDSGFFPAPKCIKLRKGLASYATAVVGSSLKKYLPKTSTMWVCFLIDLSGARSGLPSWINFSSLLPHGIHYPTL